MDADLQHPPELLTRMLDVLESGYDCCGARRISRAGELKFRSFLSNLFYKIINKVTSMDLVPGGSDFRMIKHSVVNAMLSLQESERFTKGLLSWVGFTTKWIPYENVERTLGKTKWSFKSLFNYALNGYMSFAITPLRFAVWLGGLIDVATCIWAVYFIVNSILTANFGSGYATLLLFISFFGGTTILILGIIGE